MCLINCEVYLILNWSADFDISSATAATKFAMIDAKHYAPVVALSTPDNVKLLQQFESILNRTIDCNKYQSKTTWKTWNP